MDEIQKEYKPMTQQNLAQLGPAALAELAQVISKVSEKQMSDLISALQSAQKIILHGLGREGLQMRGLTMRLFHLGLDVHMQGEVTSPPLGKGDLFFASAGPGDFTTIAALVEIAKKAGAKIAVVTAQPQSHLAKNADFVLHIPAQTMADDQAAKTSVLPMGSLYEASMMLTFELLVLKLRPALGESFETMRARHTNRE
jgi:6-phospho-3-hexuloisomerase